MYIDKKKLNMDNTCIIKLSLMYFFNTIFPFTKKTISLEKVEYNFNHSTFQSDLSHDSIKY